MHQSTEVLKLAQLSGSRDEILIKLGELVAGSDTGEEGIARMDEVVRGASAAGVPVSRLQIDASIARGLDYYTGTIVETYLCDLPAIGSVCSGGRYDNLAEVYTKQHLPGIGASLGLDRLLAAMEELQRIPPVSTTAEVFVPFFDADRQDDYLGLATALRHAGLRVELYPEPKKIGQQLKYAGERGFRIAVIAGDQEFTAQTCQIKDLEARTSQEISLANGMEPLVIAIQKILES